MCACTTTCTQHAHVHAHVTCMCMCACTTTCTTTCTCHMCMHMSRLCQARYNMCMCMHTCMCMSHVTTVSSTLHSSAMLGPRPLVAYVLSNALPYSRTNLLHRPGLLSLVDDATPLGILRCGHLRLHTLRRARLGIDILTVTCALTMAALAVANSYHGCTHRGYPY